MNLVIGATGMVGGEVCRLFAAGGKPVRAMVRETSEPATVENLKKLGVQIVYGDLRDVATFEPALEGVEAVITTSSSMPFSYEPGENDIESVDRGGMMNLVSSAKSADVRRFVYTSFSGNLDIDFPLRNAKRAVEKHLRDSGMDYTILRPSFFMEVWLTAAVGFDVANGKAQICGKGTKPVGYMSFKDVAMFAVQSVDNPAAKNVTLELGGPESLTQLEAVKLFEEIRRKNIEVQVVPEETLRSQLDQSTDPMKASFTGLMLCLAHGDPIEMESVLKTFPVKLTSVRQYAQGIAVPA